MIMEQWYGVARQGFAVEPQRERIHITGKVYGHRFFVPGATITTAAVESFDGKVCRTESGEVYELGETQTTYAKEYPNARRLLQRAKATHREKSAC